MRFYEKEDKRYKKLRNRTMSASDPIQTHHQTTLDDTRSKTDKDVDSPDNDSVLEIAEALPPRTCLIRQQVCEESTCRNFSSPGSPKVFAASRYEPHGFYDEF